METSKITNLLNLSNLYTFITYDNGKFTLHGNRSVETRASLNERLYMATKSGQGNSHEYVWHHYLECAQRNGPKEI